MMKSPRHHLLLLGLVLLGGAAAVAFSFTDGPRPVGVSNTLVRTPSAVVRSSRGKAALHSHSPASSAPETARKDTPFQEDGSYALISGRQQPGDSNSAERPDHLSTEGEHSALDPSAAAEDRPESSGSPSAATSLPEISFSEGHAWRVVDASAPGAQLSFGGQVATVNAAQPVPGSNGVALSVVVDSVPDPSPVAEEFSAARETPTGDVPDAADSILVSDP
ncbi:MAG: hypothetical protein EOP84_18385, partial [Verrucomicrobiaceae bacterium]